MSAILKTLPLPKGRRATGPASALPRGDRDGRTFIYAIAFKGGVVKIGATKVPRDRIRNHWTRGEGEVEWVHLFTTMHADTARLVETRAPKALKDLASQINGSEWFYSTAGRIEIAQIVRRLIDEARLEIQAQHARGAQAMIHARHAVAVLKANGISASVGRWSFQVLLNHTPPTGA